MLVGHHIVDGILDILDFVVEIKDIGFGDFFESSGAVARYEGEV